MRHIRNLMNRATEWRLAKMQEIGRTKHNLSQLQNPSQIQKEAYAKSISQLEESLNLYSGYENNLLTLWEHYEAEEEQMMATNVLIFEKNDKQNKVNIFEFQEILSNLMKIKTDLDAFLKRIQEIQNQKAGIKEETKNALDDILGMFGTATKMGGKKKRVSKSNK
jgi:hypothetical protein